MLSSIIIIIWLIWIKTISILLKTIALIHLTLVFWTMRTWICFQTIIPKSFSFRWTIWPQICQICPNYSQKNQLICRKQLIWSKWDCLSLLTLNIFKWKIQQNWITINVKCNLRNLISKFSNINFKISRRPPASNLIQSRMIKY